MAERVIFGSDHAGLALRAEAVKVAKGAGCEPEDLGPFSSDSVDYPDYARQVGEAVAAGRARLGVLVCGTGIGMSIAANKVRGVRAAHCTTEYEARPARAPRREDERPRALEHLARRCRARRGAV